ncbi:MAG: hypothetical protein EBS51_06085 [Planctomycetia bacterium]|nr:hypothetical protein [Planctomycetia bacterium]
MKVARAIVGWVTPLVILAMGVAAFAMLGRQAPPERRTAERPSAALVRTAEVAAETDGLTLRLDGTVVPLREVTLAAEVPGRVRHKAEACEAGRFVAQGTLLLEIDPRDYELDVARLERELTQARLSIEEVDEEIAQNATAGDLAGRQLDLARREVRRLDALKAGRIVTETEHDRAVRDELSATTSLTNLQGQARVLRKRRNRLEEAQALASTMLDKARLDLSRTRVVAPADGIVVEEHVEQDSFVSKGMRMPCPMRRPRSSSRSADTRTSGTACSPGRRGAASTKRPARFPAGSGWRRRRGPGRWIATACPSSSFRPARRARSCAACSCRSACTSLRRTRSCRSPRRRCGRAGTSGSCATTASSSCGRSRCRWRTAACSSSRRPRGSRRVTGSS